ncbi:MAG: TIGR02678 family protein [Lachnospiraceae bacterium]|nr:TIGR02678 family protein [Lachnospiraceae bacterium]
MEAVRALIENCWIDKKKDKELYTKVRRELSKCQKFFREQLGWTIINNEQILKAEKIPAHAESFMGITDFIESRDYCLFCAVLAFLEDKEEQEQFLLSELVDMLELQLKGVLDVNWTSFTQRKSLVRVLQFCENMRLLEAYEGSSDNIGSGIGQEILYENTGLSRYMAVNFAYSIADFQSWEDFENRQIEESEADRGHYRINRVYRQLVAAPALYWSRADNPDSIYLKNQRQWIQKNISEYLGGYLHIHKNAAFLVMDEEECFGERHPREAMLPELVLILCRLIREKVETGVWEERQDECIVVSQKEFQAELHNCRDRYGQAWSKEYREMEDTKLLTTVISYMKSWMMIEECDEEIVIYPAAGKTTGNYPADFQTKGKADE